LRLKFKQVSRSGMVRLAAEIGVEDFPAARLVVVLARGFRGDKYGIDLRNRPHQPSSINQDSIASLIEAAMPFDVAPPFQLAPRDENDPNQPNRNNDRTTEQPSGLVQIRGRRSAVDK
jgi:hypothetical protein